MRWAREPPANQQDRLGCRLWCKLKGTRSRGRDWHESCCGWRSRVTLSGDRIDHLEEGKLQEVPIVGVDGPHIVDTQQSR